MKKYDLKKVADIYVENIGTFTLHKGVDSGEYYALSNNDPQFLLVADTKESAFKAAFDAYDLYAKHLQDEQDKLDASVGALPNGLLEVKTPLPLEQPLFFTRDLTPPKS